MPVTLLIAIVAGVAVFVLLMAPGPGARFRHWFQYRTHKKHWDRGHAVLLARVVSGAQPGLGGRWYRGTAVVSPGRLDFTRYVAGLVKRPVMTIEVVGLDGERRASFLEGMLTDPGMRFTLVRTPSAELEIGVLPPIPPEAVFSRLR